MLYKLLACALVFLFFQLSVATPTVALAQNVQTDAATQKIKADVARRANKKGRVAVELRDGSKLKGNLSQVDDNGFTLTDAKTGQARTLAYTEVSSVKGTGGLSRLGKIGIGLGIAGGVAAAIGIWALVQIKCNEGGCP